jgi:amino acid adenylation domain-containing protein/non-ribosomal peptide synthase protein (TIGR01720 family)
MSLAEWLRELCGRGLELWLDQDRLRYRAPAGVLSPVDLERIRSRKPEVLELLRQRIAIAPPRPLSSGQRALWYLQQREPGSCAYNTAFSVRIRSAVDAEALRRALQSVVARHAILRTTFPVLDGEPYQQVHGYDEARLEEVEAEGWPAAELHGRVVAAYRQPFDLERGPVLRAHLFRVSAHEQVLLLALHHICNDFWSLMIVVDELLQLYRGLALGEPVELPPADRQYLDFVRSEEAFLSGPAADAALRYWERQLAAPREALNLPADRPRPPLQSFNGGSCYFRLGDDLAEGVRALARAEGTTLFVTVLAALQILLHRCSGSTDVVVGSPTAGRDRTELERVVGLFINMVALRSRVTPETGFRRLLGEVSATVLAAMEHSEYPFSRLVERLGPHRDLSRPPIFQVAFVSHKPQRARELAELFVPDDRAAARVRLGGLDLESYVIPQGEGQFDLTLELLDAGHRLSAVLRYNSDLFDRTTVQRMAGHLQRLLAGALANPAAAVGDLPLLTPGEGHQVRAEWNDTARTYPHHRCLHELLDEQARATPDAVAIVADGQAADGQEVSYGELRRRTDRLARRLRALGVGRGAVAAVHLERSLDLVCALVGVMKSGGAYLPLDPGYPRERISFMLADSHAGVVVTRAGLAERLGPVRPRVVLVEEEPEEAVEGTEAAVVDPEDLLYVIYTSGSTGRPKGVQVPHRAVVNFLASMATDLGLRPGDALLAATSVSFDISVLEMFLPLTVGARVVLLEGDAAADGLALREGLRRSGATALQATPSAWRSLIAAGWQGSPGLAMLCGGEPLPADLARDLAVRGGRLWNLYGPTETTVWSALLEVKGDPGDGPVVSIGRPLANTHIQVLDARLQPVPAGVPGEIWIGGDGVVRGYLGRPELTAERFVPDPFASRPGARMYRTGDVGHLSARGTIGFLGRTDHQVKVRGFRIECGEVEAALARHPGVREAVVVAVGDQPDERRLAAYVVPGELSADAGDDGLSKWQTVWDETYRGEAPVEDLSFNTLGWNDSYTGRAIPAAEMREWLDGTVARLLALRPRRVLEIGCGTGMLLSRLAPVCDLYQATDFSPAAVRYVERLREELPGLGNVRIAQQSADDASGIAPEAFDLVVLNSVVQYFPGLVYFLDVLRSALRAVAPGGAVFLGDLRNLELLEAYHRSRERAADEEELCLSPALFPALRRSWPEIGDVSVWLRRGERHNELSRFRYDVVLRRGPRSTVPDVEWMDGSEGRRVVSEAGRRLAEGSIQRLGVRGVANARLPPELGGEQDNGVDPVEWWRLGAAHGFAVEVGWARARRDGSYDVLLARGPAPGVEELGLPALCGDEPGVEADLPLQDFANDPSRAAGRRRLMQELRRSAAEALPAYMVPSAIVLLDAFPLTPNGKVDRKALPKPHGAAEESRYLAPRNATEQALARIWAAVLGCERVGVHDNFFDLGGHSLLATQVIARVREAFSVELQVRALFLWPTLAALAPHVDEAARSTDPIVPADRDEPAPLSFPQQQLWLLEQLSTGGAYNIPTAVRWPGDLDMAVLRAALLQVIRRHEVLRTGFPALGGSPVQRVAEVDDVPLPLIDLTGLPEALRQAQADSLARAEAVRGFDLARPPLLRAALVRLRRDEHVLLLTLHHIVADAASLGILFSELTARRALPALPIQYRDFARWQRTRLTEEVLAPQLSFWQEQLAGAPERLELPADRPRPAVRSLAGGAVRFALDAGLTDRLRARGRAADTTLFTTLHAAFAALLHRASGARDLVVGIPVTLRTRTELEPLIGFFVNTLVLRSRPAPGMTFAELLRQTRQTALDAFAHHDPPFERVVEALRPHREADDTPLFQAMFVLQPAPVGSYPVSEGAVTPWTFDHGTAKFDLTMSLDETADGLAGLLEYRRDLFDRSTIARLAVHWRSLLEAVAAAPSSLLGEIPLMTAAERHQALLEWNDTRADRDAELVHRRFGIWAARCPEATAVVHGGRRWTYREVNERADRLAGRLRDLGTGLESVVGIHLQPSVEMVVALLAVLKAGGAYLPLDPGYPESRLRLLLEETGAAVVVTRSPEALPVCAHPLVTVEPDAAGAAAPVDLADPDAAAYVVYTSGSTGRPKGVQVAHRGLADHITDLAGKLGIGSGSRVLQLAPLSFDLATAEIFSALCAGAALCLADPEERLPDARLVELLRREAVTHASITAFSLAALPYAELPDLETLIVGGEACPPEMAALWAAGRRLLNAYGATEATVYSTLHERRGTEPRLPLGRPLADTSVYVLDERLGIAPIGVAGEIHLGDAGVARGYRGRPDLTAERFIPDPFSRAPGARLYRTGDMARYLADGSLDFLGRRDTQIKIRGLRIEIGEVEAALASVPGVRTAAVIAVAARPVAGGSPELVAYVVGEASAADCRSRLLELLPAFMVPARFVALDAMPRMPSGKIDRLALPEPVAEAGSGPRPWNPAEEILATIFADVLGCASVGPDDDFFALGGHSLKATQVAARLREAFRIEVPVRALFESPTVSRLATRLASRASLDTAAALPALTPNVFDGDRPLSFAQERLWFLDHLDKSTAYSMPAALDLAGALDVQALGRALAEILRRHEVLRSRIVTRDGRPVALLDEVPGTVLPVVDLSRVPPAGSHAAVRGHALGVARRPFDLARGPLLRALLLRLSDERHVLLLNVHHIAFDGWSVTVFLNELSALYGAFQAGRPSPLAEPKLQYADHAHGQRQWLRGEVLETQLGYWRGQLAGAPAALQLPTDRPRPPVQTFAGSVVRFNLPAGLSDALRAVARASGATLFMALQAAFSTLLSRYTGQQDVVVGTSIANRRQREVEPLIGCFVNTLPLRVDLGGSPGFAELLARVRGVTLDAYAHQDVPFERLVEALRPGRDLSSTPVYQVMFDLLNTPPWDLRLAGLETALLDVGWETAKFDLTLSMVEDGCELRAALEYNSDLFDRTTIQLLAEHLERSLAQAAADPQRRVADWMLLGPEELHLQLVEWNDTGTVRNEEDWPTLFERQAAATPDAVAAETPAERITYRELNERANGLARRLAELGVGPESIVALCAARGLDYLGGMAGILKAGGVYLPLDPAHPRGRHAAMLELSRCRVVLAGRELEPGLRQTLETLPQGARPQVLILEEALGRREPANPRIRTRPQGLAYVLYTSGSTGTPKGAAVHHAGLTNHLRLMVEVLGIGSGDVLAQTAAPGFDISVWQFLTAPLTGGRVLILPDDTVRDPAALLDRLLDHGASIVQLVPAMMSMLLEELRRRPGLRSGLGRLRWLIPTGEALPPALAQEWLRHLPQVPLLNAYGPAECSDDVTLHVLREPPPAGIRNMPIGRPVANARAFVVDGELQPVPAGVIGELCLGGMVVGRGYLGKPGLTAEAFVPDPWSPELGARLYRTGDLVRCRKDGTLAFVGRRDSQVKIRGGRVELGEIDAAIASDSGVREVVTVVRDEAAGPCLVSYVVAADGELADLDGLRRRLADRLPGYMMPGELVALPALPLSANGKIDRRALPAPPPRRSTAEPVAPRTPVEERLARIVAEVLGRESVGVFDNFFELGGDSIISIQVAARAHAAGLRMTVRDLFQHQTVAALAAAVRERAPAPAEPSGPVLGPVPLTPIQLYFFEERRPDPNHYNQSVFLAVPKLRPDLLAEALRHLLAHHDALRLRFEHRDGEWRQTLAEPGGEVPFTTEDLVARDEVTAGLQASLSLERGPLLRAALFQGTGGDRLLILIHHLAVDGVSWRILLQDLHAAYVQLERGEPVSLPAKTTSFKAWAERISELAQSPELLAEAEGWLDRAQERAAPLPVDFAGGREANTILSSEEVVAALDERTTRALLQDVPAVHGTGIDDVLLSALLRTFAGWTGRRSLLLELEGHGREELFEDVDLTRTVGWFTSAFPVLLEEVEESGVAGTLRAVREQLRAIPHHGIGYGLLRYLFREARLAAAPSPELAFNYFGQLDLSLADCPLFSLARESTGPNQAPTGMRRHLIEVNGQVTAGRLELTWTYSRNAHRRATVERLAQGFLDELRGIAGSCAAAPRPVEYPVTALQHEMLDQIRSAPGSGVFFEQMTCTLRAPLDRAALRRAWQLVVDRHPVYRTSFLCDGPEGPRQRVANAARLPWREEDWRGLDPAERERRLEELLLDDRSRGFRLDEAPLLRCALLRLSDERDQFVWSSSHLLADGWSLPLVLGEVAAAYEAYRLGIEPRPDRLNGHGRFPDYLAWLQRQDRRAAREFWTAQLSGWQPPAPVPQGAVDGQELFGEETGELPAELGDRLHQLGRERRLTLSTVVEGAWSLLLARRGGLDEVVFGAAVACRPPTLPAVETMVGLLINTLPVRVRIEPGRTAAEWLAGLLAAGTERERYSFASSREIAEWLTGDPHRPLFESLVRFQSYPMGTAAPDSGAGALAVESLRVVDRWHYPLSLAVVPGRRWALTLTHDRRRFDSAAARGLLRDLEEILTRLAGAPDERLEVFLP